MKRVYLPLLILALLLSTISYPVQTYAGSRLDEINQQLRQLEQQKKNAEHEKRNAEYERAQALKDKSKTEKDLHALQDLIEEVGNQVLAYQEKIDKTTVKLQEIGQQLDDAEARVKERDEFLRSRVRLMYTDGLVQYLDVLMNSTSFTDFLDRYESLSMIANRDKEILQENKRDRDMIVSKKKQKEQEFNNLKNYYAEMLSKKQILVNKEKNKEVMIASLSEKVEELDDISEEHEKEIVEMASKASKLYRERSKLNRVNVPVYNGQLKWPLPAVYPLTSQFGSRVDPITGKRGAYHNGIDIGAPGGTNVLAAGDGVVIVAQWYGGFGNAVIIDHGNGLWTLYGHMRTNSLTVEKGDTVKAGQKVGRVGSTGRSTGNHLHFTVYKKEVAVDPMKYLK